MFFCLLDFGKRKLSQGMKDYLAFELLFQHWKKILTSKLPKEADNLIEIINRNNTLDYDRSYEVIRTLVEKGGITSASQMEIAVNEVHVTVAKRFKSKFLKEGW